MDTFGLFKQFASQDFIGQTHSLKDAQVNLLGWDAKGDVELDEWLIGNGFYTEYGKKGERVRKAKKGEMWRVPTKILGHYCGLDCISTLQLYDKILEPTIKRFPMYWDYTTPFIRTIEELVDQQLDGMPTDVDGLRELQTSIEKKIEGIKGEFFGLKELRPHLEAHLEANIEGINVPDKYKKKEFPLSYIDRLGVTEQRGEEIYSADGELLGGIVNGSYKNVSKHYINYKIKVAKMRQDSTFCFNPGSDKQLQWLFYERMYEATKETIVYNRRDIVCYRLKSPRLTDSKPTEILLPATASGQPPIDKNALPWLGAAGEVLSRLAKEETTLTTFVKPYIHFSTTSNDGRMHPGWKVPQAVTGRLGGSTPNVQQITGDKRVLACLVADPGYVIVEKDFCALEDYVAANVTNCPGLLALYGPDAKANDGHLWLGSQLPVIGNIIRSSGYDPDNPTQESIEKAKAECKTQRDIAKAVKYSATYGIGAFKLWQDFMSNGVDINLSSTAEVLRGYWDVFSGMKEYKWELKDQWERNRGWIYNAIGRPMPVGDHHLKDLFSRCVQGGGHDLNMMFGMHIADLVKESGLDAKPYIYNLHDAVYYQVKAEQLDEYLTLSDAATSMVWDYCKNNLGWTCELKTSKAFGMSLKELKGY
jgi:DNA polymerase I-like protein with 3'-5' exonuclease and polymerase domains